MVKKNEHLTRKVIIGYASVILIAIFAIVYIYNQVASLAGDKGFNDESRQKVYLITNILSLLYESETYSQLAGIEEDEFINFNLTMDKAIDHLDELQALMTDSVQIEKINLIEELLAQKRINTELLLEAWSEMGSIYSKSLAGAIKPAEKVVGQVEVQKAEEIKKDTVVVQRKKRGFLKRVAEVFVPEKEDTNIIVQATSRVQTDSLVNVFNPSDTIAQVIKSIQRNVADQSMKMNQVLTERTADLRYNNSIITSQINQMLLDIEEEEVNASIEEMIANQNMLHGVSKTIAHISFFLIMVVLFFVYMTIRDVYRSRYYREQLEKAKQYAEDLLQSRERLMLTISHDIRAPLSSIIGYIELLMRLPQEERQKYYLENMNTSSKHILSLVNDLLDFHRLDSGQMEIQEVPYTVPALFNEIYDSFKPIAEAKKLIFRLDVDENISDQSYLGDPIRIRQAVGNLISNAIKFTPEGTIQMSLALELVSESEEEEKYQLIICIKDEGPGIEVSEQEKIFSEFTRLAGAEKTEGFGLGLSITNKLVSLLGGKLSLQSEPGNGSEFTVILPLKGKAVSTKEEIISGSETIPRFLGNIKCLLVDDDPLQLALSVELLKQTSIQVDSCSIPQKAIPLIEQNEYDIIITDIQMPAFDGYTLLKAIRKSKVGNAATVPVVALSASIAEEKEHYAEAGFNGFLNKPFTATDFLSMIHYTVNIQDGKTPEINICSLTAFAGDDKEASAAILKTFSEETRKNLIQLEEAMKARDKVKVTTIAHKIIPVFAMLEAGEIVEQLRLIEKNDTNLPDEKWLHIISEIIKEANTITKQVELQGNEI